MRRSKLVPEVNAGSMADIAFLLLIFFLVTAVIPKDNGFNRKLPPDCPPNTNCNDAVLERNALRIVINNNDQIMVEGDVITIDELKDITKFFLDNNGDNSCNYCYGKQVVESSENPKKAVISLQSSAQTSYKQFIAVQGELTKAYYELRKTYIKNRNKKSEENLTEEELKQVKEAYPFILSETTNNTISILKLPQ